MTRSVIVVDKRDLKEKEELPGEVDEDEGETKERKNPVAEQRGEAQLVLEPPEEAFHLEHWPDRVVFFSEIDRDIRELKMKITKL